MRHWMGAATRAAGYRCVATKNADGTRNYARRKYGSTGIDVQSSSGDAGTNTEPGSRNDKHTRRTTKLPATIASAK